MSVLVGVTINPNRGMRFSLKKHPTAYGFAFLANDSVVPQVPRTITSPYPSILPNTDSLKATLSTFARVP
ncbi:MAG: hypothetical protein AUH11_18015 [Acidobacteria bacterium 13_2_20CM_57_17]|nr:MAG: hypothetical protein AUH11_18015 [Acidobacteria bacterium 13_2_20CM_57_17]OLB92735.1 MAG: hypothetical protein AUI02_07730 [Acidobacteria bacterium 13_2_20CM_2_57_12]OLE16248.1 MAG: hypothetical protein AUG83_03765 [Acidobacteria bacterium 13_1_20CM_4_57_11]